jgi:cell division inhibitor SepF
MSVFHKTMVWLGLVDDEEYYGDDEYYVDEYGEPVGAPARQSARTTATVTAPAPPESSPLTVIRSRRERDEANAGAASAVPRPAAVKPMPMPAARVYVLEPKGFNDAQEVGDRLKSGQPVILNLQGVDRDLQRRLIDFSSGLAYAVGAKMERVNDQVFLLTPTDVEVSQEEKERLQARGLYQA